MSKLETYDPNRLPDDTKNRRVVKTQKVFIVAAPLNGDPDTPDPDNVLAFLTQGGNFIPVSSDHDEICTLAGKVRNAKGQPWYVYEARLELLAGRSVEIVGAGKVH